MSVVLWIVQGILAAVFLMGGVMKATQPGGEAAQAAAVGGGFLDRHGPLVGPVRPLPF